MKKIILLLAFCLSVGNLFAQDANADKLREEGDAAMTAKNYPEVVAKYSEYLKLTNYEDESRIFNCAFAAYNAKKYDDAIKFYVSITFAVLDLRYNSIKTGGIGFFS